MRKYAILIVTGFAVLVTAAAAFACGGGGSDEPDATAVPTEAAFDTALITSLLLNPDDMPGYQASPVQFASGAVAATSTFDGNGLYIQSTVSRQPSAGEANAALQRNRQVLPALSAGTKEENYQIPGADLAFLYTVNNPPGLVAWFIRDRYLLYIQIAPTDYENPSPAALDRAELARLSALVAARTNKLIETPDQVTPAAGGPPAETATPALTPPAGLPTTSAP